MSASFFSLNLPPLPSALCHPEVSSFSQPPSWGPQLCPQVLLPSPPYSPVHSAPDTSTAPVPPLLCRARFSPVSSTQSPQHPCNDSSPASSSYCCQSPCSETQTASFLFLPYTSLQSTAPLETHPARPPSSPATSTRQSAFQPLAAQTSLRIHGPLPPLSWTPPGLPQDSVKGCLLPTAFLRSIYLLEVSVALSSAFSRHQGPPLLAVRLKDG